MPPVKDRLHIDPYFLGRPAYRYALHHHQKIFLELLQFLYAVNGGTGKVVEGPGARPALVAPAALIGAMAVNIGRLAVWAANRTVVADILADKVQIGDVELVVQKPGKLHLLALVQIAQNIVKTHLSYIRFYIKITKFYIILKHNFEHLKCKCIGCYVIRMVRIVL